MHIIALERVGFSFESGCSRTETHVGDLHFGRADHADDGRVQPLGNFFGQFLKRGLRKHEEVLVLRVPELFPAKSTDHASLYSVRVSHVPVVVKAPDDHVMLLDEGFFGCPDRVIRRFELIRLVQMAVERRLVRDDQIVARRCCTL